ncbi:MAG: Flp pilus assembly complex ATPase component TadA [Nanohaloarchaea archaeon]|nr:Flp pilus assembly complex ATPase component TadA [Candidatus Nanohaloarchaea archaeon]
MSLVDSIKEALSDEEDSRDLAFENTGERIDFTLSDQKDVKITSNIEKMADVDVKYPLIKPFAYAHIKWNKDNKELLYRIIEPELEEADKEALNKIKDNLSEKIDVSLSSLDGREKIIDYLQDKINELLLELGISLSEEQHDKILYYIYRDFVGLGKVEPFMHDPYIEDLGCDGTNTPIFAVHSEFGSVKSDISFDDGDKLENLVIKLAERCGRYVSYANPLLDGALPDGSRVNASLTEDVTAHGPTFSIRKFQDTPFSAIDIMDLGTANAELMAYMWICQQYNQSILVCGGTATGKTSFLNSIVSFIPPEDKIVSIEDTRELQLPHENWIPSVTREMFGTSSQGDVDMDQLLKESFRQNPDYVVVGEVRGEEASVLFQGMSSGHPSIGTMHASSPNAVVKRLITPPISLSPALIEAIDVMVIMTHAKGVEKSARRAKGVHELQKVVGESASARTNEAFSWTAIDDSFNKRGEPYLFDQISKDFGVSKQKLKTEMERRTKVLKWLQDKGVKDFHTVSDIIAEYYKNKDEILKMVNSEEDEYTLDDIIEAEEKVDISRDRKGLDEAMEKEQSLKDNFETEVEQEASENKEKTEKGAEKNEKTKIHSKTPVDHKKRSEKNPVAELEQKLKAEREKINEVRFDDEKDENPFQGEEKTGDNPFEA